MATTETYLSTINTVVAVAIDTATSKIIYLPAASTIQGQSFWVKEFSGALGNGNVVWLSTIGIDKFDNTKTLMAMSTAHQTARFYAQNLSNYAVLQNSAFSW